MKPTEWPFVVDDRKRCPELWAVTFDPVVAVDDDDDGSDNQQQQQRVVVVVGLRYIRIPNGKGNNSVATPTSLCDDDYGRQSSADEGNTEPDDELPPNNYSIQMLLSVLLSQRLGVPV